MPAKYIKTKSRIEFHEGYILNNSISEFYFKRPEKRLQDIDHLIDYMDRLIHGSLRVHGYSSTATHLYYPPPTHSALDNVCAEAFAVLKKLDADEEFQQYLQDKKNGISRPSETDWFWHHVIVPLFSSPKVETPLPALVLTIDNIKLLLDEVPVYWQHDIAVLLDVHRIIGDGIRSDRTIRLDLVLKYYLITPSSPQTEVQWMGVLDSLKELRAACILGHDDQWSDLDLIMDDQDDKCMLEVIYQIQAEQKDSLINYLAMHFFTVELEQQITGTPTVVLEQLVNTENSLALGRRLVKALDWYGSKEGETCPQPVLAKLVWRALWLSVAAPPTHPQCLYSTYDMAKFTGKGVSYSFIRNDIVKDLMGRLDTFAPVARLVMRVIEANTSSELWVRDIPDDLTYTGSSTWVNFRSGFILAEAMASGSSRHMTFEQLLNLPAEHHRAASPEHQALVAASRLAPAVQWAVGNGVLAIKHQGYSTEEIERAIEVLEEHERDTKLNAAMLKAMPHYES